jgi:chromosomal replication initiation ATPase DnaA
MYFVRKETSLSLKAIAGLFTNIFDHSTVIHAISTYNDIYKQDKMLLANHNRIIEKLSAI